MRATLLASALTMIPAAVAIAQDSDPVASDPNDALGFGAEEPAAVGGDDASTAAAGGDDALGFGAAPAAPTAAATAAFSDQPSPFRLAATVRMQTALRAETAEPHRIAKLRQVLDLSLAWKQRVGDDVRARAVAGLHTEADFIYLADMSTYDGATLDVEAWQARTGETYLSLAWPVLELCVGYQIVNLGQGEMIGLLDLVNPRDLREPLSTDPSNLRIPVLLSRLSLSVSMLRFEGIVVHEAYFGLLPPPLGEWSPFRKLLLENPSIGEAFAGRTLRNQHVPARDPTNLRATQVYGRASASLGSADLALVAGSTLERLGVPILTDPAALEGMEIDLPLLHSRYTFVGHSGAWTAGPFVLRWELAFDITRPLAFQRTDSQLLRWEMARRHMLSGMLGLSYSPLLSTSAAIELVQSYVFDNPERDQQPNLRLLFPVEATQLAFRFNHRFWSDRASLSLILLWIGVSPLNGWTARGEFGYALSDVFEVGIGYVTYQPSENFGFFYGLDRHDRIFLNVRWELGS